MNVLRFLILFLLPLSTIGQNDSIHTTYLPLSSEIPTYAILKNSDITFIGSNQQEKGLYLKCDSKGNLLSYQEYGGDGTINRLYDIEEVPTGGYIATGVYSDTNYLFIRDRCEIKRLDTSGNTIWNYRYPAYSEGLASVMSMDGNILTVGNKRTYDSIPGTSYEWYFKLILLKLDITTGDTLWTKIIDIADINEAVDIISTSDSNFVILAKSYDYITKRQTANCIKFDKKGKIIWHKQFGNTCDLIPTYNRLIETSDGGFAFTSYSTTLEPMLYKLDVNGDSLWARKYSTFDQKDEYLYTVYETSDKGFVMAGRYGIKYGYLLKVDKQGIIEFRRDSIFPITSELVNCTQNQDGTYTVMGKVQYYNNQFVADVFVAYLDNNGNLMEITGLAKSETETDLINLIPNPAKGQLRIVLNEATSKSNCTVEIYDLSGKLSMKHSAYSKDILIDIESLKPAMYILLIKLNGKKYMRKFVKQ